MPHPDKANSGGADSHFADPEGRALGIADGVGEWEWRFGVNARAFADELMAGCQLGIEQLRGDTSLPVRECALRALQRGYAATASFGSSTSLVASLGRHGELGVANLGDSALLQLRRLEAVAANDRPDGSGPSAAPAAVPAGPLRCVARTREQQHSFNCPYQLMRLPSREDFPELLRQGKDKLVRVMERQAKLPRFDLPEDAELYSLCVQEGDLIILGTDGVFDNLHIHEIIQLANEAVSPAEAAASHGSNTPTDPASLATAIVRAAYHRSLDRDARTPFGDHARQAGLYHRGGKMDDITCVCAWVVQGPDSSN